MTSIKRFLFILAICVALSIVLAAFEGLSLASLISVGSIVGAGSLLLGAWRQSSGNGALEMAQDMQHLQNLNAARSGRALPHQQLIASFSSGPLFFAGLFWLVLLQAIRYGFDVIP
jgi:hypothetical protein